VDTLISERSPGWAALNERRLVTWLDSLLRKDSDISVAEDLPLLFEKSEQVSRRLIIAGGRPAAHAAARLIDVECAGGVVRAAVIGAVATDPKHRRRGLGSRVIATLLDDLAARGVALAILWADVPKFYEGLGFALAGRETIFICPRQAWHAPRRTTTRLATDADLRAIRILHEHEACRVRRDEATWRKLLALPKTDFYVIEREGRVIAYGVVGKGHDLAGCLHEWGGEEVLLPVLVGGVFSLRTERELYVMSPPWKRQAARAMGFHHAIAHAGPLAMLRALDRPALRRSLGIADVTALPEDHGDFVRRVFGCPSQPEAAEGSPLPVPFYLFGLDSM
jgi:N-acetylglutamate synthase-like GNAT family acetyltransferase